MESVADILTDVELDEIIKHLRTTPLEWVGNETWSKQMSVLEQINVQAALEASRGGEERVRDRLVENGKMPLLVHELLLLEMWREKIMPKLLNLGQPKSSFQMYMVMFNEANVCNILETIMFGPTASEALEEASIDLVDYAVRHLTLLCSGDIKPKQPPKHVQDLEQWKPGDPLPEVGPEEAVCDELNRLRDEVTFQIAMKCISLVRYLTDHIDNLPLGVANRLCINHDAPVLLAQLLESKPWIMSSPGQGIKIFEGSDWAPDTTGHMAKLEGQTWIALYNLLSKKSFSDKYQLHHYRLNVLGKLAGQINDVVAQQLPILAKLKEWLTKVSIVKPHEAEAPKDLIFIETVAEISQSLEQRYAAKLDEIAHQQKDVFLNEANGGWWQGEAGKLLETLDTEAAQQLMTGGNRSGGHKGSDNYYCGQCHAPEAKQRCSRCKSIRYCSRECQAKDWPRHRGYCNGSR